MHKSFLLLLGTIAALSLETGTASAQECVVKVGRVVPITGPLLDMGRETPWLDENKLKHIRADGGLKVGDRMCRIGLVDRVDPPQIGRRLRIVGRAAADRTEVGGEPDDVDAGVHGRGSGLGCRGSSAGGVTRPGRRAEPRAGPSVRAP